MTINTIFWRFLRRVGLFVASLGLGLALVFASTLVLAQLTDSGDVDISAVVPGAPEPPGPGGGGGSTPKATVVMSGWAFPNAKLTLLKDGAVTTSLIANNDGSFQITLNNLNYGNYQLSIFAEDPNGTTSSSHTINVGAFSTQPYTFDNIIIPPTITTSHLLIIAGQQYSVFGYAPPGSLVEVLVVGVKSFGVVVANGQGYWQMNLLGEAPFGVYSLRARATFNSQTSLYSKPVQVLYSAALPIDDSTVPQPPPPPQLAACVDFNQDRRVNLIDFSILLFWFGKDNPPPTIDCNRDGVIDIKDFSILMFFWTG